MKIFYDNIQVSKSNYGKVPSRNYVVASVNLTVYHHYKDVDKTGKKMQLFFGNQGPSDTVLLKRQESINDSKQSETLCGSAITVSGETRACVNSLQQIMKFVSGLMGKEVTPLFTSPSK